jgi:hypothetical protein
MDFTNTLAEANTPRIVLDKHHIQETSTRISMYEALLMRESCLHEDFITKGLLAHRRYDQLVHCACIALSLPRSPFSVSRWEESASITEGVEDSEAANRLTKVGQPFMSVRLGVTYLQVQCFRPENEKDWAEIKKW